MPRAKGYPISLLIKKGDLRTSDREDAIPPWVSSVLEKEKAGSIRGGTGSGGQSSQQINAIKN